MTNSDNEFKKTFETFVGDLEKVSEAVNALKPLEGEYFSAIEKESTTIAAVEKYCGFLQIEAANVAAKNDEESNNFKQALYLENGKLQNIVATLNDCKSGLKEPSESLKDMVADFNNCINTHLNTINESITKASSYLAGYVPTEKEEVKDNTDVLNAPQNETKDNNIEITDETKVVGVEPQIEAVPLNIQNDSLEELNSEVEKEMDRNHTNIGELMATSDSYKSADENVLDNSAPFNFDQMNLASSDELTDSNELSDSVNIEEPIDTVKPTDDEIDISQWFANNSIVDKPNVENNNFDELSGSTDETLNDEVKSDNIDESAQKVVNIESMYDVNKLADDKTEDKNNDFGLTLEKAS